LNRDNKLSEEKIKAFRDINFEFPKPQENQLSWEERFEELLQFKKRTGIVEFLFGIKKINS